MFPSTPCQDIVCYIFDKGERTADVTRHLLSECPSIFRISEKKEPQKVFFSKALEESRRYGCLWILLLDADILVYPSLLEQFFATVRRLPLHVKRVDGFVLDKLVGNCCRGGILLSRVEQSIMMIDTMPSSIFTVQQLLGIRGFEQDFAKIANSAAQMIIHNVACEEALYSYWCANAQWDEDFSAALLAYEVVHELGKIWTTNHKFLLDNRLLEYGYLQKLPLCPQAWTEKNIFHILLDTLQDEHRYRVRSLYSRLPY